MKLICGCGAMVVDSTDYLPNKAHYIPDRRYEAMLVRIEALIESRPSTPLLLESAFNLLMNIVRRNSGTLLQCRACGRLHVEDEHQDFHSFLPETKAAAGNLFERDRDAG